VGKWDIHMQESKNQIPISRSVPKSTQQRIKDLNVRHETLIPLEENIRKILQNTGISNNFLNKTPIRDNLHMEEKYLRVVRVTED
jgi:hypothetical protein